MIGTLTSSPSTSLLFRPAAKPSPLSGTPQKTSFANRNRCKAALHAFAEMPPPVETRRRSPPSLYDVLQVNRNASQSEIKSAYRRLAKMYHPDATESDSDGRDFMKIHSAYATLSDPSAKSLYDLSLSRGLDRRSFGYSTGGYQSGFYTTRKWETDQCW
ncbi:hypothetical protein LguiA_023467 [Lonicera macranthoides]